MIWLIQAILTSILDSMMPYTLSLILKVVIVERDLTLTHMKGKVLQLFIPGMGHYLAFTTA